jgi:hypothetical protein
VNAPVLAVAGGARGVGRRVLGRSDDVIAEKLDEWLPGVLGPAADE